MAHYKLIKFTLNGKPVEQSIDVRASLADVLRGEYVLKSIKKGCKVGECGSCSVIVDGHAVNSCIYLGIWADGRDILTLEGIMKPDGELHPMQQAFIDNAAIQCGYCTPGFILSSYELYENAKKHGLKYTDEQIKIALSGHLCRCTGYVNIFKAVKSCLSSIDALA